MVLSVLMALAPASCGDSSGTSEGPRPPKPLPVQSAKQAAQRGEPEFRLPRGRPPHRLVVKDLIEGSGPVAGEGDELTVEYVGVRYSGAPFTNSWKRRKPFRLTLGANSYMVNPGWEKGLPGMRLGGRRELIVPPDLLFQGGAPPESTPADTLVYAIDLVAID